MVILMCLPCQATHIVGRSARGRQTTQKSNVTVGGISGIHCIGVFDKTVFGMGTPISQIAPIPPIPIYVIGRI
jgi:hypothetical protein